MKTLFNALLVLSISLFCVGPILGQGNMAELSDGQREEMQEEMQVLIDSMKLTEAEKYDFIRIAKKYSNKLLALKGSDASRFSKYRQFKSISKARNKEMKKLLSAEQYTMYLEKQKEMQAKMKALQ